MRLALIVLRCLKADHMARFDALFDWDASENAVIIRTCSLTYDLQGTVK